MGVQVPPFLPAIWKYFTFSNQMLSAFALWTATAYLVKNGRNFWITALPGTFITASLVGYLLTAKEFPFGLSHDVAVNSGFATAAVIMIYLVRLGFTYKRKFANA